MVLYIYKENGEVFEGLALHKATFESVVMSLSDKITGEVLYKNNSLPYTMREYVIYNGTKYYLKNPPTIVRNGMADSSEHGFTKYSFEFYHPTIQLFSIPFTDVAVDSKEYQYKAEDKTFQWIGKLSDFCIKINKNLEGTIFTCDYAIYDDGTTADSEKMSEVLTFDNVTIADALKVGYETFKAPFIIEDILSTDSDYNGGKKKYRIRFGKPSKEILGKDGKPFVFKFGQGLGLKNNSATPKNNKIITRIAGQGSETNIPWGYPQIPWTGNPSWDFTINNDPKAKGSYPIYNGIVNGKTVRLIKHPFTRKRLMPSVYRYFLNKKVNPRYNGYDPYTTLIDYIDADGSYVNPINVAAPSYENHIFEDVKPSIKGLKYKDTPIDELYYDAVPVDKNGDDVTNWDDTIDEEGNYIQSYFRIVLPRLGFDLYSLAIENQPMTIAVESGECNGCKFEIQVDWEDWKKNFYIEKEINGKKELVFDDGTRVDANGRVYIPEGSHRDAFKYPLSIESPISVIVKKDIETFGTIYPNIYQQPKKNDKYVFLGISLPQYYILTKEQELDAEMKEYMRENNVYYFDYPLVFDEFFLTQNQDILSQIRTNSLIRFEFGREQLALSVKQISIKYGENPLPKYDIVLTDDVSIVLNSIGQVTEGLSRLGRQVSTIQAYYNKNIFKDMFDKLNTKLSKNNDDVAHGEITFDKWMRKGNKYIYDYFLRKDQKDGTSFLTKFAGGIKSTNIHSIDGSGRDTFVKGELDGRGYAIYTDVNGDTYLEVDNITARKRFVATVLDIQKETFSAGNLNLTNANGTIFRVYAFDGSGYNYINIFAAPDNKGNMVSIALFDNEYQQLLGDTAKNTSKLLSDASYFKIYFTRTDGFDTIEDLWHNGDMAKAQTLNLLKQRSWHRVVTSHGIDILEDGKEYNYIIVSNEKKNITITDEFGKSFTNVKPFDSTLLNSVPQIGDKVVQYGSVTEIKRQGMTRLDSSADGDGGLYVKEGIGSVRGTNEQFKARRTPIEITPRRTSIVADEIKFATRDTDGEIIGEHDFDIDSYKILMNKYATISNNDGTCNTVFTFSVNKNNSKTSGKINVGQIKLEGFTFRTKKNNEDKWRTIALPSSYNDDEISFLSSRYPYSDIQNRPYSFTLQMLKNNSVIDEYSIPIVVSGKDGKDGTSVSIKGEVKGHFKNVAEFNAATKVDGNYLIDVVDETITSGDKYHWIFVCIDDSFENALHPNLGDGYIDTNGDFWVAIENGWKNVGKIKGDDGKNGKDAILVEFNPTSLVITEKEKNVSYDGLNTNISVAIREGEIRTASKIQDVTTMNCTVSFQKDSSYFTITGVSKDVTDASVIVGVAYKNMLISMRFDIFINRLGTWSLNVKNDTMKAVAGSNQYHMDGEKVVLDTNLSVITQNANEISSELKNTKSNVESQGKLIEENTSKITQQANQITSVVSRTTDLEKVTSEIKQTADSISLKVKNDGGLNLLKGTKLLRGEQIFLYPEGLNTAVYEDFTTIGTTLLNTETSVNYIDLFTYSPVYLKPSTIYTLSFMYIGEVYSNFDTYIYNKNKRICEYVKNNVTGETTTGQDGHSHFNITNMFWSKGSIEFKTTDKVTDTDEVSIIIGRMFRNVQTNNVFICAPKLEYGSTATEWRPNDNDTEANLAETGIDIVDKKITLTADKVEFRDNNNKTTAVFVKDKLNINLINVQQVVTDGLTAKNIIVENATIDGLVLTGTSRLGQFTINKQYPYIIENGRYEYLGKEYNNNRDVVRMQLSHYNIFFDYFYNKIANPNENSYQTLLLGQSKYASFETLLQLRSYDPKFNDIVSQRGLQIDVLPTPVNQLDDLRKAHNDAIYIKHGSFCGFRPRLRRVLTKADREEVNITPQDYTVLIGGVAKYVKINLPSSQEIDDGQRVEVRMCAAADNDVLANGAGTGLSDKSRIGHNQMKIYIYDKVTNIWWVNTLN